MTQDIREIIRLMEFPAKKDIELVQKAADYAAHAHRDHKRFMGEPHYIHLYGTAVKLAELKMGAVTIAAGFLHDVIEDTDVSPEMLEKDFGKEIRFLVEGVTKLKKIKYRGTERTINSMRKLFVAMAKDIRVLIIKLCDRTHNMETLHERFPHKQFRVAQETLEIYAPLAYRLGMRKINRELEDLVFPYVYPKEFEEIKSLLNQKYKKNLDSIDRAHKSIKKALAKDGITQVTTEVRVKSLYSLYKKYIKKNKEIDKIYDICAIRVIVPTIGDCYRALGVIHGNWTPLPGRIKDYIALPKINGYRSIHTTIFTGDGGIVEVQIRTEKMHREAEFGIASHISFKEGKKSKENLGFIWIKYLLPHNISDTTKVNTHFSDIPHWVKYLAESQESIADGDEFMQNLKDDFFEHRIFVFNPKGEVVDLPIGATPVDFAYTLYPQEAPHLYSAKINGKMSKISSPLENGDIVEIETNKTSSPTEKWLLIAKSTLAKEKIKEEIRKSSSIGNHQTAK